MSEVREPDARKSSDHNQEPIKHLLRDITAEPDGYWGPASDHTPSVVTEVGDSQSNGQLVLDARHWLENFYSTVQLAIIVKLKRNPDTIQISIWKLDANRPLRVLRNTHRPATRIQSEEITRTRGPIRTVTFDPTNLPPELRIPFQTFTGPSPPPGFNITGDLIISDQDLLNLARNHFTTRKSRNGYV